MQNEFNNEFDEETKTDNEASEASGEYAYKNVLKTKKNRRTWSVISLALAILAIEFIWFPWVGVVFALASIVCALISRKNLGYFDKLSLAGIFVGIFGVVFSVVGLSFGDIIKSFLFK